jgi:undecaprenyl-diphosphatase
MDEVNAFDLRILDFLAAHRTPALTWVAQRAMEASARPVVVGVLAPGGLAFVAATRRWRLGVAVVAAFLLAGLASGVIKSAVGRPRPPHPPAIIDISGYAMPSTHAAATAAAATAAWLAMAGISRRVRRLIGAALAAGLAGIGFLMAYLGAHWTLDVFAGWALGVAVGTAVWHATAPIPNGRLEVASP